MFYSLYVELGQNMWFEESPKMDFEDSAWERVLDMCNQYGINQIVLDLGKELYRPHVDKYCSEYLQSIGRVIANKKNPSLWGIKLELEGECEIADSALNTKTVPAGGVIPILRGLKIKFPNGAQGEIE